MIGRVGDVRSTASVMLRDLARCAAGALLAAAVAIGAVGLISMESCDYSLDPAREGGR